MPVVRRGRPSASLHMRLDRPPPFAASPRAEGATKRRSQERAGSILVDVAPASLWRSLRRRTFGARSLPKNRILLHPIYAKFPQSSSKRKRSAISVSGAVWRWVDRRAVGTGFLADLPREDTARGSTGRSRNFAGWTPDSALGLVGAGGAAGKTSEPGTGSLADEYSRNRRSRNPPSPTDGL